MQLVYFYSNTSIYMYLIQPYDIESESVKTSVHKCIKNVNYLHWAMSYGNVVYINGGIMMF